MSMKPYAQYKPTDFEWLDTIPAEWRATRLRLISQRFSGGTPDKKQDSFWRDGTIPWLNSGAVNQGVITESSDYITEEGFAESSAKWIPNGSVVIALAGQGKTKGMAAYTAIETTCNQSMAAVIFDRDNAKFMYYWLTSQYKNIRGMASSDGRDGLNLEMIGSIPCPLPSPDEQREIVAFVEHKTAQIDALIEKKQALIEKLNEKRTAVITQAVTKGLDPNAPMKDSGVVWLGEVPAHWDIHALKNSWHVIDCKHLTAEFVDEGFPLASIGEVQGFEVNLANAKRTTDKYYEQLIEGGRKPKPGDVIYSRNATVGKAAIVVQDLDFAMGQDVCLLRKRSEVLSSTFLWFQLNADPISAQVELAMIGSTFKRINVEQIRDFSIVSPPKCEQEDIAEYLIEKCAEIKKIEKMTTSTIKRLTEYRRALVTSAVTGQIDVRDFNSVEQMLSYSLSAPM